MRPKFLIVSLLGLALSVAVLAQVPSSEQLDALKQALTPEQQQAIMQSVGKTDTSTTKTDQKLSMPSTVQPKTVTEPYEKLKEIRTHDGRTLRRPNEDPQLRADDTVLIDLISLEELASAGLPNGQNAYGTNAPTGTTGANAPNGINPANPGAANLDALAGSALLGANPTNAVGALYNNQINQDNYVFKRYTGKPKTEEEREQEKKFRQRILRGNPYRLNRFGVLEIPGLPSIPLAGLTASEATRRLNGDPDLQDYQVKLTLLRLEPYGDEALKPFGYDLFEGEPSTFAPVSDIAVPLDYVVGPGDQLNVQLFGNEPSTYKLTVGRDGNILFPKLGPIEVGNMTFDSARSMIERRVGQQLIGTRVSITMGDLRSIRVFVLGEAEKPGSYTVNGLSTMTNALFVSGGVKKIGSLRNIELKRNGQLITVLDLYDLLLHGDTSGDRKLLPGDVIFIPPIGNTVSISGSVHRPAIYETKGERNVSQLVQVAGGLMPDADPTLAQLERITPSGLRQMINIDLNKEASRTTLLVNGDKLRVPQIRPTLENSVTLSGYVYRPGQFEYRAGLRLSDILGRFEELRPEADIHYIMVRRIVPPEDNVAVVSADLARALAARGSAADILLRPRDEIIVFNLSADRDKLLDPIIKDLELQATPDKPEQVVNIDGRVKAPGRYPLEPTMHVSDLIRAGGSLEDSAYRGAAELTRYAVVNGDARKTDLITVNLDAIRRGEPGADLLLKPYDTLVIKPIPMWMEPGTIEMVGEVRYPGKYPIHQGETLHSVLLRAGGFTEAAFPEGAVFIREELKKREKEQLEMLTTRMQSDLAALSLMAVASSTATGGGGGGSAGQAIVVGQQLLSQLRDTKPVGRLVIDIDQVIKQAPGATGDVVVRNGDKLLVPKQFQDITILGEVQSPTSHVYQPGLSRDDYIAKSGGLTQKADKKRIYVVRANGSVFSGGRSGWFRRSNSIEIHPGDTIVVPLNAERVAALPLWQSVTTIIYNLAIALLAIHSVT